MSCKLHKNKPDVKKCVVCGTGLCDECAKFQDEYGACPTCLSKQAQSIYVNLKRGIKYNILSLVCSVAFLVLYIVEICLGRFSNTFIIVGAIILALLLPLSIYMFVKTILRLKEYKKFLISQNNKR